MTRREELQDKYEDAVFALIMDDIARIQAREAEEENERLKNDPSFTIPEDVHNRCLRTIRHHVVRQRAYAVGRGAVKALKRVPMVAGIMALMFTGAFAVSETVRINTINLIVDAFDTSTVFRFVSQTDDVAPLIGVGWLPEGYTLESHGYDNTSTWYQYQKNDRGSIHIDYSTAAGAGFSVDTENAKVEYVDIQGAQAMLIEKDDELQLVWVTNDNAAFIGVVGSRVERDDLIHIAKELKY